MAVTNIKPEAGTQKHKTVIFVEQNNEWVVLIAQKCEQPFLMGELHPLGRWLVIKLWKPVIWTAVAVLGNWADFMAVSVFPAPLSTEEFSEELPMEGQGRRKVLRVLKQSFGDLSAGHVFFPSAWASIFHKREHTWASSPGVPSSQCALVSALNGVSVLMHFSSVNLTALLKCCFRQDEQPWLLYHLSLIGRKSSSMELHCVQC